MTFNAQLQRAFLSVIFLALIYIAFNFYQSYQFKHSALSLEIQTQIDSKEREIILNIKKYYGVDFRVPLIISDKLPSNLYGLARLDKQGNITVFINKKRLRESLEYVLDDVIAHEYAHAFMFDKQSLSEEGHTARWQEVCLKLGGVRCDRFVNHGDVVMGKMPF